MFPEEEIKAVLAEQSGLAAKWDYEYGDRTTAKRLEHSSRRFTYFLLISVLITGLSSISVIVLARSYGLGCLHSLLQLVAKMRGLLHLLHGQLVALQGSLDNLYSLMLPLCQLLKPACILLLLLKQLLIHSRGAFCLIHQLMDNLIALLDLLGYGCVIHCRPPYNYFGYYGIMW
jgi:hypothetical protein